MQERNHCHVNKKAEKKWLVKEYEDDSGIIFPEHNWNSAVNVLQSFH